MRSELSKLEKSGTDHVPIIAKILYKLKPKKIAPKKVTKRSMKHFTQENWLHCLATKRWEYMAETENVKISI